MCQLLGMLLSKRKTPYLRDQLKEKASPTGSAPPAAPATVCSTSAGHAENKSPPQNNTDSTNCELDAIAEVENTKRSANAVTLLLFYSVAIINNLTR